MSTVAFIGLGAMGSRMATNLLAAGHSLRVFNRSKEKTEPFADKGAVVCDSPAAAAKGAEFVCSIVSDDVASRAVMLGDQGVVGAAAPGTIILDSSTNTPAMAREVAVAAQAKGAFYLDAPVSGSLVQAQAKELVILVGGDKAAFDRALPVLGAMGRMVRRIGDSGAGATLKLINNMLSATLTAAIAEAAQAAEAANLDRDATLEVLGEGAAGSRLLKTKLPKIFKRDFTAQFQLELMDKDLRAAGSRLLKTKLPKIFKRDFTAQFQLELMDKDLRYFLALAQELDRPAPIASLVRSQYQAAKRAQLGKLDSCAVFLQAAGERPKA